MDEQWLILDNRRLALVRDLDMAGCIHGFLLYEDSTRRVLPIELRWGQAPADRAHPISCRLLGFSISRRRGKLAGTARERMLIRFEP